MKRRFQAMTGLVNRRRILLAIAGMGATGVVVGKWGTVASSATYGPVLRFSDQLGLRMQRLILSGRPLAPEFRLDQITPHHPTNGGFGAPWIAADPTFDELMADRFRSWRLYVHGLVERPSRFTLSELRAMPARTQITMHSCDMGWSAIAQWAGVPLHWLLEYVGVKQSARYVVFHCMDKLHDGGAFYSSIDMLDAFHPQTILAHTMNRSPLARCYGAPLRLRVELQIGYKNSKHIQGLEVVDSLKSIGKGYGGTWEDKGSQWYAGM